MKMRKTRMDARGTYPYKFADGTKIVLTPGVDGVTEADIAMLHRIDDREVENNNGEWKPKLQPWQKKYVEDWKERNPNEPVPNRTRLSTDALMDTDNPHNDEDKSNLAYILSVVSSKEESVETQAVKEFVELYLNEEQRELYERVLVGDETVVAVAAEKGVTRKTIHKYIKAIKEIFKNNFENFLKSGYTS